MNAPLHPPGIPDRSVMPASRPPAPGNLAKYRNHAVDRFAYCRAGQGELLTDIERQAGVAALRDPVELATNEHRQRAVSSSKLASQLSEELQRHPVIGGQRDEIGAARHCLLDEVIGISRDATIDNFDIELTQHRFDEDLSVFVHIGGGNAALEPGARDMLPLRSRELTDTPFAVLLQLLDGIGAGDRDAAAQALRCRLARAEQGLEPLRA